MDLTKRARELRKSMTEAEQRLWLRLRNRQLGNLKFRRQVQLGQFIVDFYCHELRLIVEVDGGQHDEDSDWARTVWLNKEGYRLIRFWNNDVLSNIDAVLECIADAVGPSSRLR